MMVFPELRVPAGVLIPQKPTDFDPWIVKNYAPYLRRQGLKLKRRAIPRIAPMALHFSEVQTAPTTPGLFPQTIVTIETKRELTAGYIVVEFHGKFGHLNFDFGDIQPVSAFDDDIDNPELKARLPKYPGISPYVLKIGKTPVLPSNPIHIIEERGENFHVSSVTFFDE
jgi:hypothetical protein